MGIQEEINGESDFSPLDTKKISEDKLVTYSIKPKIIIVEKKMKEPIEDYKSIDLTLETRLIMPEKYSSDVINSILDDLDTIELAEYTIELIDYNKSEARKAILKLLESENRKFLLSEISEKLKMDLKLAHEILALLEKEKLIK